MKTSQIKLKNTANPPAAIGPRYFVTFLRKQDPFQKVIFCFEEDSFLAEQGNCVFPVTSFLGLLYKVSKTGWLIAMEIYCLRLLEIRNPILGILARLLSSGGSLGECVLSPSLRRLSATLSILGLQLYHSSLCLCLHQVSSILHLCFLIETLVFGLGPTLIQHDIILT